MFLLLHINTPKHVLKTFDKYVCKNVYESIISNLDYLTMIDIYKIIITDIKFSEISIDVLIIIINKLGLDTLKKLHSWVLDHIDDINRYSTLKLYFPNDNAYTTTTKCNL